MNTEQTFTLNDLINFAVRGDHAFSLIDALRFVGQFLEGQGKEISREEFTELVKVWMDENGYSE